MSENTDFNNEEATNQLRSYLLKGFLSELDNDMQPKEIGELYERAKGVLAGENLKIVRGKIQDKINDFEGGSSVSSDGASRGGQGGNASTSSDQKSATSQQQNLSGQSGKQAEFDQYGRRKNPNYSNIKGSIIDKLCERNVSDEELDKILEMTRRMAGMSAEDLRKAEAMAAAKNGNQEIAYNDIQLPNNSSVKDKLDEVRMRAKCLASLTDPRLDMRELAKYVKYKGMETYKAYDYMEAEEYTSTRGIPRDKQDAAQKALIAAKLLNSAMKNENFEFDLKALDAIKEITEANSELALWQAAIIKKHKLTDMDPNSEIFNNQLSEFKRSLAYDMLDSAVTGKSPMKHEELNYTLTEIDMLPEEKLDTMRVYLDHGDGVIGNDEYTMLKNIVEQDAKYAPEVMDILQHRTMDKAHHGHLYYDYEHDAVLRTCLEQNPELITQELYNNTKNNLEKSGVWEAHSHAGDGSSFIPSYAIHGYSKENDVIAYMESVNPKLKENWQESRRQQTNFNQGIRRGGMGNS